MRLYPEINLFADWEGSGCGPGPAGRKRLIGDRKAPEKERICRVVSPDPKWHDEKSPLRVSGLMGPVFLRVFPKQ